MAMRVFLDHKEAFDCAYAWYCYYRASSKMNHHRMPGYFDVTKQKLGSLQAEAKDWFRERAKGTECDAKHYDEEGQAVFLIKHGSYVRTVAYWKKNKIEIVSFRPANEDILFYNKETEVLSVKASLLKDRNQYIKSFSGCIVGDDSLADSEDRDTIYTLRPLLDGSFNWDGNEDVKRVLLTEIKLRLPGNTDAVINISSKDPRKTLAEDVADIRLDSGELKYARFRFILHLDGKELDCKERSHEYHARIHTNRVVGRYCNYSSLDGHIDADTSASTGAGAAGCLPRQSQTTGAGVDNVRRRE